MESITKNRQPVRALRAMVARAYGPGQVPAAAEDWVSELGHGWFNVAYRIRLRDGSRAVLKIAPPLAIEVMTYEQGAMATELAALRLIREHTGVPVPAVQFGHADTRPYDFGREQLTQAMELLGGRPRLRGRPGKPRRTRTTRPSSGSPGMSPSTSP